MLVAFMCFFLVSKEEKTTRRPYFNILVFFKQTMIGNEGWIQGRK